MSAKTNKKSIVKTTNKSTKPAVKKAIVRTARSKPETRPPTKAARQKSKEKAPFNYRGSKVGAIKFRTASKAAVYMLRRTNLSQSEIARRLGVSQPCVCQLAATLK